RPAGNTRRGNEARERHAPGRPRCQSPGGSTLAASINLSKKERTLRARLAAHTMHSKHDPRETTANARAAFRGSFDELVDPDRVFPESERRRRAEQARKAHYTRLAFLAARARKKAS